MNQWKTLALISLFIYPINALAMDSAQVQPVKVAAMNPNVVLTGCITTEEERYTVAITNYHPASPTCPPNMVIKRINFRTETYFTDVNTYVSVECCYQQIAWQTVSTSPQQAQGVG